MGVLLVKENTPIQFSQLGGEQEMKRRAGTENVPQIIGFTKALELANNALNENNVKLMQLKRIFS